jgi:DNA-binding MarR family transcriptional regulator
VIRASSEILAIKGRDLFNKLSPVFQELVVQLYRDGSSSYAMRLARELSKTHGRISQILSELSDLGYVERKREQNKTVYTLCRALHNHLEQMFGEQEKKTS